MRKRFTLLIALMALCVSAWATTVTWDAADVASVNVTGGYNSPRLQTVDDITIIAYAPAEGDYCYFSTIPNTGSTQISTSNDGKITFAPTTGKLTDIVINLANNGSGSYTRLAEGWSWDYYAKQLTWHSDDAVSSAVLDGDGEGIFFTDVQSIEFTVVPASGSFITWDAAVLANVNVSMSDGISGDNVQQTFENITVSAEALASGDVSNFYTPTDGDLYIRIAQDGKLTFAPESGKAFTNIVISCAGLPTYPENLKAASGWAWDPNTMRLSWAGDAATSVNLECDASSDGFYFNEIISVVYNEVAAPAPSPDPTFTWEERQINLVSMSCDDTYNPTVTTNVIKNIILRLEKTGTASPYDNCDFGNRNITILNNGTLTFQSIVGELTGIVITCGYVHNADNLSADWTYDSENYTLAWAGTPSDQVSLSGLVELSSISSIEFSYTPAAAPNVGTQFWGIYDQKYEITGAHTAKLPVQSCTHTLNIPASVEYLGETYYVTEIADYAFRNQDDLPNILNGHNIARIGEHAFDGCLRMSEAMFESTVLESIGDEAFKNCKLMQVFQCPAIVPPTLGSDVFDGDNLLNHIRVEGVATYAAASGWSDYSDKLSTLWGDANIGEIFFFHNQTTTNLYAVTSTDPRKAKVMPYIAEVDAIYPRTLEGTLVIPEEAYYMYTTYQVTGIGPNAYKNITTFDMVLIPQRVTSIEAGAFTGCTGVEKVFFLWDDPTAITWADGSVGADFKTAASGNTRIFVPEGRLTAYQAWAPAWASCMVEGALMDVTATQDPEHGSRYYRTFFDSKTDYMMPPSVWAHAGYVDGDAFILRPVAFDGQILPHNTAVVLESETDSYRLIPTGNDAPAISGRNDLIGSDVEFPRSDLGADADKVYVLNRQATIGGNLQVGMGLYRYTGTNLGAHKAYMILDIPAASSGDQPAPARFLFKHEQTPTDVENVQSDKVQCTKVLRDGQLIIVKDGKEYNAQGFIIK